MDRSKPILKKSKYPTKVGDLGYLNTLYCPRCGKRIFTYYDKDRDPDKNEGYKLCIWHEVNFCSHCGLWLDLDEWKDLNDTSVDINNLYQKSYFKHDNEDIELE